MGNRKYVHLVFMVGALVLSWVAIQFVQLLWSYGFVQKLVGRPHDLYSRILGIIMGVGLVGSYWLRSTTFDKVGTVVNELSRVTWPTKQETSSATYVVIVTVFISAIIMGVFDWWWSWFTDFLLSV